VPAEILPVHTPALFREAVAQAAARLRAGEVVALPTETVYGLAANAWSPEAVRRIFHVKQRPAHNPVIVHVASADMAHACAREWPLLAARLASAFWPGPLTLVVPRSGRVPNVVTAGGDTVGMRWPFHPFMQAVIRECGFPLAAPSANPANALSPTTARHVADAFGDVIPLIVDGGESNVGIESTVVDVTGPVPRILRPGMISSEDIARACGMAPMVMNVGDAAGGEGETGVQRPLRSPGQLSRHYAPRARLHVLEWASDDDLGRQLAVRRLEPDRGWIIAHSRIPAEGRFPHVRFIPDDPEAFARALYAELHAADADGIQWVVVERVPDSPAWAGIADRLARACVG